MILAIVTETESEKTFPGSELRFSIKPFILDLNDINAVLSRRGAVK
jgi:hypothetical protein